MVRIARAVAYGLPHHVVHRGNNKQRLFFAWWDYEKYLSFLKKYSAKFEIPILTYCLMTNHVHLLVKPQKENSLAKMLQGLSMCYAQYINKQQERSGTLWEGRYYSSIVGRESYLWAVVRYIEQNPVRAKIAEREVDYPYSSARAHLEGAQDDVLGEAIFAENERMEYIKFAAERTPKKEIKRIRASTKKGIPFGSESFIAQISCDLHRNFTPKPVGRPINPNQNLIRVCP